MCILCVLWELLMKTEMFVYYDTQWAFQTCSFKTKENSQRGSSAWQPWFTVGMTQRERTRPWETLMAGVWLGESQMETLDSFNAICLYLVVSCLRSESECSSLACSWVMFQSPPLSFCITALLHPQMYISACHRIDYDFVHKTKVLNTKLLLIRGVGWSHMTWSRDKFKLQIW